LAFILYLLQKKQIAVTDVCEYTILKSEYMMWLSDSDSVYNSLAIFVSAVISICGCAIVYYYIGLNKIIIIIIITIIIHDTRESTFL